MMGLLYDVETHSVNYHLKKVFDDAEWRPVQLFEIFE